MAFAVAMAMRGHGWQARPRGGKWPLASQMCGREARGTDCSSAGADNGAKDRGVIDVHTGSRCLLVVLCCSCGRRIAIM